MSEIEHFAEWVRQELDGYENWQPPTTKEVCPSCRGEGKSTRYLGDVTEMCREDPDFAEDYWRGFYDRTCDECQGRNVIDVPDESRWPEVLRIHWKEWEISQAETNAIYEAERRMGA
jgi:hypothetical protein